MLEIILLILQRRASLHDRVPSGFRTGANAELCYFNALFLLTKTRVCNDSSHSNHIYFRLKLNMWMKPFIQTPQLHFNPIFHFVFRLHTGLGFVNSLDSRNNLYSPEQTLTGMRASNIVPEFCSQHSWNGILVAISKAMSSAHLGHTAGLCLWAWGAITCLWKITQRIPQISQVFSRYPEFLKFEYSLG